MKKTMQIKKQSLNRRKDKPAGIAEKVINLLKIINRIEQGDHPTAKKLAEEGEVSERSIYRYLNIINFIVPIIYDKQKGGYRFEKEDALRIIPFESKELALLTAFADLTAQAGEPLAKSFQGILNKISAGCTGGNDYKPVMRFSVPPTAPQGTQWFDVVTDAIINKTQAKIRYHAINTGELTSRTVNPYGLSFNDGIWFLYAFCHLRKDFRWFALDRIERLTVLKRTFEKPGGFDMAKRMKESWGIWEGEKTEIKVRFAPEVAEIIKRKPSWHMSEKRKILPSGEVELTLTVSGTDEIKWWIYSWIPYVEVIRPKWLRKKVKNQLSIALQKHS